MRLRVISGLCAVLGAAGQAGAIPLATTASDAVAAQGMSIDRRPSLRAAAVTGVPSSGATLRMASVEPTPMVAHRHDRLVTHRVGSAMEDSGAALRGCLLEALRDSPARGRRSDMALASVETRPEAERSDDVEPRAAGTDVGPGMLPGPSMLPRDLMLPLPFLLPGQFMPPGSFMPSAMTTAGTLASALTIETAVLRQIPEPSAALLLASGLAALATRRAARRRGLPGAASARSPVRR